MQNVDQMSTQYLVGKAVNLVVNTQLLDEAIKDAGRSKSYLADKCGMSIQTFRLKRLNVSPFTTDQVETLCEELAIKGLARRDKIFFAKKVE